MSTLPPPAHVIAIRGGRPDDTLIRTATPGSVAPLGGTVALSQRASSPQLKGAK